MEDLTPNFNLLPADQEIVTATPAADAGTQPIGGFMAGPNSMSQGNLTLNGTSETILVGSATAPLTGIGIFIGNAGDGTYDFRAGDPAGNYIQWDGSAATLTIVGAVTATSGTIGGWHINSTSIYTGTEDHSAYTANAGDVTIYSNGTDASIHAFNFYIGTDGIFHSTSGTLSGVSIASVPNDTSTDISLLSFTHDLAFSVTDKDTIAWTSGTITMSNGRTFSISSGNTGNMAALTYIYLDTGASSTVLQTTTTASSTAGANKILIATAQNQNAQATFVVYGGKGGLQLSAAQTSISNNDWTYSGAFSVTDADTIAWASGTLTTSNGGSYSITGSNTGNMAAKTYIYFDLSVSTTALQTTTTASSAVGDGKIMIAAAKNGTNEASYILMNDNSYNIDGSNIVAHSVTAGEITAGTITATQIAAGTITANEIAAGTITAAKMSVSQLSAIAADMGSITAGTVVLSASGYVRSGQTDFDTGTGFFVGISGGAAKFSIGNSAGNKVTWDGTSLNIIGGQKLSVRLTAAETIASGDAVAGRLYQATPIALDFKTAGQLTTSGANTISLTVGSNSNSALLVFVGLEGDGGGQSTISSITWNGSSLTTIDSATGTNRTSYSGYKLAPSTGTHNLVITTTHMSTTGTSWYAVYSLYNVAQSGTIDAHTAAVSILEAGNYSITTTSDGVVGFGFDVVLAGLPGTFGGTAYTSDTQTGDNASNAGYGVGDTGLSSEPLSLGATVSITQSASRINVYSLVCVVPATAVVAGIQKGSSAASNSRLNFVGFAQAAGSVGDSVEVAVSGIVSNLSSISATKLYYLNDSNGTIGTSAGSVTRKVAMGLSSTQALITNIW